ncbi:MAG: carboxylase [Paramuribaculum sp.]|nr:carboxylase [Paramuribaculum sp.]
MENRKLKIRDLTLRDGQQSLFATRMSQQTIDRLLPFYENAGYYIMEVWGGAVPDSVMRYLGESPWDRLRKCSEAMKGKSLLSALSRGRNLFGYVPYPDSVLEGFYKEAIANGLNVMRIFDALNDIDNVRESIRMINSLGGIADGAVCYTVDPKDEAPAAKGFGAKLKSLFGKSDAPEKIFTDEYFVTKAKEMEALGAKIITLKDMAGLVNPLRAASIISALKRELSVPVDFHTHCTPGYGLASSVMAMIHGVDILDTNIWWFGGGSAAPAIELIYIFAQRLGIEVDVNMEAVGEIRNELLSARKELSQFDLVKELPIEFDPLKDTLPEEISRHFDEAIRCGKENDEEGMLEHCHAIEAYFRFPKPNELVKNAEVPGGMYSNMVAQLKSLQADDVLDEAMALIPKVRRDAGLVPLVTPTSQIVGSQAVFLALDRKKGNPDYSNTSNQFMSLIKGEYGKTPVAVDPAFREKITGDPIEHPYDVSQYKKPDNPVLEEFGGVKLAANDEEYLLLELLPAVANGFLRNKRAAEYAAKQAEEAKNAPVEEVVEEKMEPITGEVLSGPMPGTILEICVKPGDSVKKGDKLLVYESMKMENDVEAEHDAVVKRIFVKPGDRFAGEAPLIEFQD